MRRFRIFIAALSALGVGAIIAGAFLDVRPFFVWNATASAPIGLYMIRHREPDIGHFVLVKPGESAAQLIEERGYLPPGAPLIKRVSARSGDAVCRRDARIFINEIEAGKALREDSAGRKMPVWSGCFSLKEDQFFLLNDHEKSLDGRYFGLTDRGQIIGVAEPLWVRKAAK